MPAPTPSLPPPRAFSQGVGTLFQTVGVTLFLIFTFVCCGSALLSKEWATRPERQRIGWAGPSGQILYSERDWMIATVMAGVLLGLATAGIGLGLQADKRRAACAAVGLGALAFAFWLVQGVFAVHVLRSLLGSVVCFALAAIWAALGGFAVGAVRDLAKNPPDAGQELLPKDFHEPCSHLHQDSPEARLAGEIAQRRQRLEVEQKELEAMEKRLRRKLEDK